MRAHEAFLCRLGKISVERPRTVLAVAVIGLLLALAAVPSIDLRTSNLDLVDAELPAVRDFRSFARRFGSPNLLVVAIEGEDPAAIAEAVDDLALRIRAAEGVRAVVAGAPRDDLPSGLLGRETLGSDDGRLALIFVQPLEPDSRIDSIEPFVGAVGEILETRLPHHPGVRSGLTGLPQYALDDRDFVRADLETLSGASLLLVGLVFAIGFRSLKEPLAAVAALAVGVGWTLGVVAVFPGHLTLLSAFFASILFGLGIDPGIHLCDRTLLRRSEGAGTAESVVAALGELAPSLATSTLTTASVFLLLTVSGFRGFAELGLIAGTGMVVCLLAAVSVLPALLVLLPEHRAQRRHAAAPLLVATRPAVVVVVAAAAGALLLSARPSFNGNYLDLQPIGSPTVELERRIVERTDFSTQLAALTVDSPEDLRSLVVELLDDDGIGEVRSLADLGAFSPMGDLSRHLDPEHVAPFRDAQGSLAVYVAPRGDPWDDDEVKDFLEALERLGRPITGMPVLGRFMIERSKRAMRIASLLGLAALPLWLALDLRRVVPVAVALLPTLLTVAALPGLMRLFGLSFNPLDVMALPIVIGIAVDDGVHLVHRFLAEDGRIAPTLASSGRSIVLTSLTTLAAFAPFAVASHRGLASFAKTMMLGVGFALVASVVLLVPVLGAIAARRPRSLGLL